MATLIQLPPSSCPEPGARPEVFHLTVVMALIALETLLVKCSIDRFKLDWINTTAVLCDNTADLDGEQLLDLCCISYVSLLQVDDVGLYLLSNAVLHLDN